MSEKIEKSKDLIHKVNNKKYVYIIIKDQSWINRFNVKITRGR